MSSSSKSTKTSAQTKAAPAPNVVRYCRFEDSTFDNKTRGWVRRDLERIGLRMCPRLDCTFTHRIPRPKSCADGEKCVSYNCGLLHPKERAKVCRYGAQCWHESCTMAHPDGRPAECANGSMCLAFAEGGFEACTLLHPSVIQKVCRFRDDCKRYGCVYIHSDLSPHDCEDGMQCQYRIADNPENRRQNEELVNASEEEYAAAYKEVLCQNKHPRYTRKVQGSTGLYHFA
ncbi:MAG: hypothetical protein PHG66_04935 [Candidatus Colwellbacteria bacterium]|nr:hypothetical protein [Candidatus Colwellbacteria bacterium]